MATSYPTPNLTVQIISPDQILYSGPADAISCINPTGPFDILPQHIHLISIINDQIKIHHNQNTQTFAFKRGILRCKDNSVDIYITQKTQ